MKNAFKVVNHHLHLLKENTLVIKGYFPYDNPDCYNLRVTIDGKDASAKVTSVAGNAVRRRYINAQQNVSIEYTIEADIPQKLSKKSAIELWTVADSEKESVFRLTVGDLLKEKEQYVFNIDSSILLDGKVRLIGWTAGRGAEQFHLYEGSKELEIKVKRGYRKDVLDLYQELPEDFQAGFEIEFENGNYSNLKLVLETQGQIFDLGIDTKGLLSGGNPLKKKSLLKRIEKQLKEGGVKQLYNKSVKKISDKKPEAFTYMDFKAKFDITQEELEAERKATFDYRPLFSIVVPLYNTPEKYFIELIESVINQTYDNWELVLADGSQDDHLGGLVEKNFPGELRIRYSHLEKNGGISENTNAAMALAKGHFIVLADHDDLLSADALFECAKALNADKTIDVLYSDEDKISMEGDVYFEPSFKPDFNIDYLTSTNYICHLFVLKKEILDQVGPLNKKYDGAQDHDFILRCVEAASQVHHIPKVLYHWRCHIDSTAMNLESKLYALENGAKAVQAHFDRINVPAKVSMGEFYGTYHTVYEWQENPLVSIIIPTKDHVEDLKKCIASIDERNSYKNIEFVIVENNSVEQETFEYYKELEQRDDVTIVTYEGGFNFSAINNLGAKNAKGQYLLLLNNDTEIINEDCIKELLGVTMRPDVGICGALLFYPDNTIQHAGVVMGIGGIAGHTFVGLDRSNPGYMYRIAASQDLTAVTAACLMIKKNLFDEIGGFTESLAVAFNDVDLCLKVRKAGYLVVYNPYAQLYHYESKSRGMENSAEKQARFTKEIEKIEEIWPNIFDHGDQYYNPNLSLVDGLYKLKEN